MTYETALEQLRNRNPTHWEQAKHDATSFVEKWGEMAGVLGLREEELFGLHPTAPFPRYDVMGLVWIMQGNEIVDLTAVGVDFGATKRRRCQG
jgi:hypothetical protein